MAEFIAFHIIKNIHLEIYICFLFESVKTLNKGISKILLRRAFQLHLCISTHVHMWMEIVESFPSVCIPFRSTREPRENNFHHQCQRYFYSSIFMHVHYRNQIYCSCCYNMACIKSKEKYFFLKLK